MAANPRARSAMLRAAERGRWPREPPARPVLGPTPRSRASPSDPRGAHVLAPSRRANPRPARTPTASPASGRGASRHPVGSASFSAFLVAGAWSLGVVALTPCVANTTYRLDDVEQQQRAAAGAGAATRCRRRQHAVLSAPALADGPADHGMVLPDADAVVPLPGGGAARPRTPDDGLEAAGDPPRAPPDGDARADAAGAGAAIVVRLAFLQVGDTASRRDGRCSNAFARSTLPAQRGEILDRFGSRSRSRVTATDIYADPTLVEDPRPRGGRRSRDSCRIEQQGREQRARVRGHLRLPRCDRSTWTRPSDSRPSSSPASGSSRRHSGTTRRARSLRRCWGSSTSTARARRPRDRVPDSAGGHGGGADGRAVRRRPADLERADTRTEPVPGHHRGHHDRPPAAVHGPDRPRARGAGQRRARRDRGRDGPAHRGHPTRWRPTLVRPERSRRVRRQDAMRNRAVTDVFEPGSVNKIITAAAALETGAVSLEQRFRCPSSMQVGPFTIHDSHVHPIETMTLGRHHRRVQQHRRGTRRQRGRQRPAGRLPGAVRVRSADGRSASPARPPGVLLPASQWDEVIRATVSYGQGISVTPMQMATVYATIANDGALGAAAAGAGASKVRTARSASAGAARPARREPRPRPIC